jgi:hypothetical protein
MLRPEELLDSEHDLKLRVCRRSHCGDDMAIESCKQPSCESKRLQLNRRSWTLSG